MSKLLLKVNSNNPESDIIDKVVTILEKGGIVIYPTETAYGIGCDALNEKSVAKIYAIKNRPKDLPLPVIVSSKTMIESIAVTSPDSQVLVEKFMPGPIVIALPKKDIIPDVVNKNSIAFRISSNKFVNEVVTKLGNPLISTSANLSGYPPPYSIDDVKKSIPFDKIDIVIDGGKLAKNKPSTIVDFTLIPTPQITRIGEISLDEILSVLKVPKKEWRNHVANY